MQTNIIFVIFSVIIFLSCAGKPVSNIRDNSIVREVETKQDWIPCHFCKNKIISYIDSFHVLVINIRDPNDSFFLIRMNNKDIAKIIYFPPEKFKNDNQYLDECSDVKMYWASLKLKPETLKCIDGSLSIIKNTDADSSVSYSFTILKGLFSNGKYKYPVDSLICNNIRKL